MLARDERCCSGRDGRRALQRSRVGMLRILLSQPSRASSSLSLLQHSPKTIWSQSQAPAAQHWSRGCPQEPSAGFSPPIPAPQTVKSQLAQAGQQPPQTRGSMRKMSKFCSQGKCGLEEPEKGFWPLMPLGHSPLRQVMLQQLCSCASVTAAGTKGSQSLSWAVTLRCLEGPRDNPQPVSCLKMCKIPLLKEPLTELTQRSEQHYFTLLLGADSGSKATKRRNPMKKSHPEHFKLTKPMHRACSECSCAVVALIPG